MGMRINIDKKRVQHIGRLPTSMAMTINQRVLEQTDEFTYLGRVISTDGTVEQDIRRTIGVVCDETKRLAAVWRNKDLSNNTKVLL